MLDTVDISSRQPRKQMLVSSIYDLISETSGPAVANHWLVYRTSYPGRYPSPEQLKEGIDLAFGATVEQLDSVKRAVAESVQERRHGRGDYDES